LGERGSAARDVLEVDGALALHLTPGEGAGGEADHGRDEQPEAQRARDFA
jgi:hypothetical protein